MLLTTVIATLSYLAINNTQQQYQSYEKSNDVGLEIAALNTLLKNDFHKAKDIQLINGAIVFQMTDYRVVYQFEEKKVKRTNQTKADILDVIVLDKQITFKNEPIQKGRIDQLQLECKYFEDKTRPVGFMRIKKYLESAPIAIVFRGFANSTAKPRIGCNGI